MDRATLGILSTFSALLPIIVGSSVVKKHPLVRWFVLFLAYGFLTDIINFLSDESGGLFEETVYALFVQNIYSLVDACFLFWFLAKVVHLRKEANVFYTIAVLMVPLWVVFSFMVKNVLINGSSLSAYFDTGYEMLLAVSAAYVLLKMTEQGQHNPNQALLWLVIGVFFFNFCIFFLHSFISNEIADHIWFMGNFINIATMLMYTFAFYKLRRQS